MSCSRNAGCKFDGTCASALKAGVCDYLARMQGRDSRRQLEPHMESAMIAVVRRMLLEGLKLNPPRTRSRRR